MRETLTSIEVVLEDRVNDVKRAKECEQLFNESQIVRSKTLV